MFPTGSAPWFRRKMSWTWLAVFAAVAGSLGRQVDAAGTAADGQEVAAGLVVSGAPSRTPGEPVTMAEVWR